MGGKPVAPLGRRQAELLAHRPAEPRARFLRLRPDAFIEAAEDHHIGLLQPRFKRAPDGEAGMGWPARPRHAGPRAGCEEGRVIAGLERAARRPRRSARRSSSESASPASPCHSPDGCAGLVAGKRLGSGEWASASRVAVWARKRLGKRRERREGGLQIGDEAHGRLLLLLARRGGAARRSPRGALSAAAHAGNPGRHRCRETRASSSARAAASDRGRAPGREA